MHIRIAYLSCYRAVVEGQCRGAVHAAWSSTKDWAAAVGKLGRCWGTLNKVSKWSNGKVVSGRCMGLLQDAIIYVVQPSTVRAQEYTQTCTSPVLLTFSSSPTSSAPHTCELLLSLRGCIGDISWLKSTGLLDVAPASLPDKLGLLQG